MFGLSRLTAASIRYVHATRAELAQLAVIRERMRFARDLHDLLGYSLSAITLKAELTRRLVGSNPERARDELADVVDIARQALADVRLVASGYRNMSLAEGGGLGRLAARHGRHHGRHRDQLRCRSTRPVDTVLATMLREAVTNMLGTARREHCTIKAERDGRVRHVAGDQRRRATVIGGSRRDGGGLENLAMRLEAVGGN